MSDIILPAQLANDIHHELTGDELMKAVKLLAITNSIPKNGDRMKDRGGRRQDSFSGANLDRRCLNGGCSAGEEIAFMPTEKWPTNLALLTRDGETTLYVTAGTTLYRIPSNVPARSYE